MNPKLSDIYCKPVNLKINSIVTSKWPGQINYLTYQTETCLSRVIFYLIKVIFKYQVEMALWGNNGTFVFFLRDFYIHFYSYNLEKVLCQRYLRYNLKKSLRVNEQNCKILAFSYSHYLSLYKHNCSKKLWCFNYLPC